MCCVADLPGEGFEDLSVELQVRPQLALDGLQTIAQLADRVPAHDWGVVRDVLDYNQESGDGRNEVNVGGHGETNMVVGTDR